MMGRSGVVIGLALCVLGGCGGNPAPQAQAAPAVQAAREASGAEPADVGTTGQMSAASASSDSGMASVQTSGAASLTSATQPTEVPREELLREPGEYDELSTLRRQRGPSPEIERELEHIQAEYRQLPALTSLPDFLSVNDLLALLPVDEREYMREELHTQLQNRDGAGRILGAHLDSDEQYFLLWVPDSVGLSQVLAIYNGKGALLERRRISRGKPLLRNILELEAESLVTRGYTVAEVFIERITTMSVCCLPSVFEIYALTSYGKLRKLLEYPRAHTDVGPGVTWQFLNHFEFSGTRLTVSPVVGEGTDVAAIFEYSGAFGRYLPLTLSKLHSKLGTKPHLNEWALQGIDR